LAVERKTNKRVAIFTPHGKFHPIPFSPSSPVRPLIIASSSSSLSLCFGACVRAAPSLLSPALTLLALSSARAPFPTHPLAWISGSRRRLLASLRVGALGDPVLARVLDLLRKGGRR
jgi:hypothetical protein